MTAIAKVEETFGKNFSVNRLFTDKVGQSQKNINGQIYHLFTLFTSHTSCY